MPYLPESRQYRSFAASNFKPVKREESDQPTYTVEGHFTVFDYEYELCPGFFETVARTALDGCDMSDVVFQFNHSSDVLARQRNGSLRVGIDDVGGWCEARLDGCQRARDIFESIQNGLIDEMSFGFIIDEDGFEWTEDEDGTIHSTITRIAKLYDVSCVDRPASPATEIHARDYAQAAIDAKHEADRIAAEQAEQERIAAEKAAQERIAAEVAEALARRKRRARAMQL